MFVYFQYWRLLTSKMAFLDIKDIALCAMLIYNFRFLERRFGSRKYVVSISALTDNEIVSFFLFFLFFKHFLDNINAAESPSSHLPITFQLPSNHLPVTFQLPSNHLPITFQLPSNHLPITFQLPSNHLPITFQSSSTCQVLWSANFCQLPS